MRGPAIIGKSYQVWSNDEFSNAPFVNPGYSLVGWKDQNGEDWTKHIEEPFVWTSDYAKDITLYAQWEPIEYTITYNGNGDLYNDSDYHQTVSYGSEYVIWNNFYTPPVGYGFAGWVDQDGTDWTSYIDRPRKWNYTKDITLYAQWEIRMAPEINRIEVLYRDINNTELSLDNNSYIKDYTNCSMKIYFTMDINAEGTYFRVTGDYVFPSSDWIRIDEEENKYCIEITDSYQLQEYFSLNSTDISITNVYTINDDESEPYESNVISLNAIYKDQVPKVYINEEFHNCLVKTYKEIETGKYGWVVCDLPKI